VEGEVERRVATDDVGIVLAQYLIVLLQHSLQFAVVLCLGLLHQPVERLHPFVVRSESRDETLQALVRGLLIARPQTRQDKILVLEPELWLLGACEQGIEGRRGHGRGRAAQDCWSLLRQCQRRFWGELRWRAEERRRHR
jgi:hypothetical protein